MSYLHLMGGVRTGRLARLLRRRGLGLHPMCLARGLFLFQSSLWSSLFAFHERRRFGRILKDAPVPADPIVIVGHWRSGSTFLHQLFAQDPHLTCPTVFQCLFPDSFLVSRARVGPLLRGLIPRQRPMDSVAVTLDAPQEDEFALLRLTDASPLEDLFYPTGPFFLTDFAERWGERNGDPAESPQIEEGLGHFLKKIHLQAARRIVLKNPFHSLRMRQLLKVCPRLSFVHVYRDPLAVIPSTLRMWTVLGRMNVLKGHFHPPKLEELITVYDRVLVSIRRDLSLVPADRRCEMKFEELEAHPVETMSRTYAALGMDFSGEFRSRLEAFLGDVRHYKKNTYTLTSEERQLITQSLQDHRRHYGYVT